MPRHPLYLSHDADFDYLACLPFGRTDDGHHPEAWRGLSSRFGYMLDRPGGRVVGFKVLRFSEFEPERQRGIWHRPRFDVPVLGLGNATAGEICLAAKAQLDGDTINRIIFACAVHSECEEAALAWRHLIEAGDPMGHFGLGYTLLDDLCERHGAYKHLRIYTEIARYSPWAWSYRGQAAEALGDVAEARQCYERALELEELQDEETDADERLAALPEESVGRR